MIPAHAELAAVATATTARGAPREKWLSIGILLVAEVAAMSVWFASSAAASSVAQSEAISRFESALLTSAVQIGFVAGTFISAVLGIPDRFDPRRIFMTGALVAAVASAALALASPGAGSDVLVLRFTTGAALAGVYPIGMRLAATWANSDLGLLVGLLVGALTLGSASPHALAAVDALGWRTIYVVAACLATFGGLVISLATVGPNAPRVIRLQPGRVAQAWRNRPLRLANLGYLGHMWELYAMWTWLGVFLAESFAASGVEDARSVGELVTFGAIASGALGAWVGGVLADRWGRTTVTIAAMAASGTCATAMGWLEGAAPWIVTVVAVTWGVTIIADSAQFSASIAELAEPDSVGSMLTIQTCAGFLLTVVSIQLVRPVADAGGWPVAFTMLAIGPALGCLAMARLRHTPEAMAQLAGGRR